MEETEQRLAAARAKRATAQALIDAQKQLVDQAAKEERALKEQLDAERTSAYEGKFVRGQSINGTVRAVKYGEAYISWADGVDYAIKFEHLDMCLERYEDWAAGVLQDWDCAPSGACLDGLEAPPPLVEAEPAADAAPALPSPRSVVATPAVAPFVAAAPVLPLIEEAPKPLVAERVVAATADDDDVPVEAVVDDVAAATGGHKAAGEILPTRQAQPVAEPGGADAAGGGGADDGGADAEQGVDAHGVEAQGADAEMEDADAEGGGEKESLDADGVEAATGGAEGDVVVEEGAEEGGGVEEGAAEFGVAGGVDMEGVEATGGGADGEEGAVKAMEEGDDDTISIVETGVGVAGATGAVEEEGGLEALGVPSNAVDTVSTVGISMEIKISRRPVARDLLVDPHRSSRRRRTSRGATGSSPFTARARSTAGPSPSYQRFAGGRGRSRRSRAPRRAVSSAACCTTTSCSRRTSRGASFGVSWPRPTPVRVLPLCMLPRHCR